MLKRFVLILVWLFLFVNVNLQAVKAEQLPKAHNGVIDLTQWQVTAINNTIPLNGEWEFYWEQLLEPKDLPVATAEQTYAYAPSQWSQTKINGEPLTNHGYATYRLITKLNMNFLNEQLALYIPASCSAYRVWVNQKEVASSGIVGTSKKTETPWTSSRVVYFTPLTTSVEIVVQISNFHQRKNGMWDAFLLGKAGVITKKDNQDYATQLLMIGSFMVMSIFYFFTYFFRRVNKMALYFSSVCFLISIRLAVIDGYILRHFIPTSLFEVVLKLEYLSISLFGMLLIQYMAHLFPHESKKLINRLFVSVGAIYSIFVLMTPAAIYTLTLNFMLAYMVFLIAYQVVYVFPLAVYRKRGWAKLNMVAAIIVIVTYINDIIYYTGNFEGVKLAYIGFLVFFLVQIIAMADGMSNAFKRLEDVSNELLLVNSNLEFIVKERTKQLEELNEQLSSSNEKLQDIERSRRKFLSNISHDIGTPMQSAMGYVEMMINGLIKDNYTKYLQIVYDKLTFIKRLSSDLFELTKMEENQIVYQFVETDFQQFLKEMEKNFALDFERKELVFQIESIQGLFDNEKAIVKIDVFRVGQVFQNLLQNAMKFTLAGGTIRIVTELSENREKVIVRVIDTGIGIAPELLPQVFNRFVKGDEARQSSKEVGMGLGLSIVNEIVLAHSGEVFVSSELEVGSVFTIVLPVTITEV